MNVNIFYRMFNMSEITSNKVQVAKDKRISFLFNNLINLR